MAKKITINSKRQDEIAENVMDATLDLCKMSRLPGHKLINVLITVLGVEIYGFASEKDDEIFNAIINEIGRKLHLAIKTIKNMEEEDKL